jgi:hypothetical protein
MRAINLVLLAVFVFLSSTLTSAQNGFFSDWFNMVSETQAAQPHWITPSPQPHRGSNRSFATTFNGRPTIAASRPTTTA